jgi:hypothetical protein
MRAAASRQGVPALCGALKPSRGCIFLSVDPKSPAHDFIRKLQTDHVPIDSAKFQQVPSRSSSSMIDIMCVLL